MEVVLSSAPKSHMDDTSNVVLKNVMISHVHLLDTSVAADNLGDEVIVGASQAAIARTLPDA